MPHDEQGIIYRVVFLWKSLEVTDFRHSLSSLKKDVIELAPVLAGTEAVSVLALARGSTTL